MVTIPFQNFNLKVFQNKTLIWNSHLKAFQNKTFKWNSHLKVFASRRTTGWSKRSAWIWRLTPSISEGLRQLTLARHVEEFVGLAAVTGSICWIRFRIIFAFTLLYFLSLFVVCLFLIFCCLELLCNLWLFYLSFLFGSSLAFLFDCSCLPPSLSFLCCWNLSCPACPSLSFRSLSCPFLSETCLSVFLSLWCCGASLAAGLFIGSCSSSGSSGSSGFSSSSATADFFFFFFFFLFFFYVFSVFSSNCEEGLFFTTSSLDAGLFVGVSPSFSSSSWWSSSLLGKAPVSGWVAGIVCWPLSASSVLTSYCFLCRPCRRTKSKNTIELKSTLGSTMI